MLGTIEFEVLVRCMTYNQSSYILDALKGFVIQKTNFPYLCLIMDDASTDGEQQILVDFINQECDEQTKSIEETDLYTLIQIKHKANSNCHFCFYLLKQNLYRTGEKQPIIDPWRKKCKYEALCEGDDFWTSPDKLQRQYDFMESHPDFVLCFGDVIYFDSDRNKSKGKISLTCKKGNLQLESMTSQEAFYQILLNRCHIQTLTVFYRLSCLQQIKKNDYSFMMGDTCLWLDLSQQGKIKYIHKVLGTYNIHQGSAVHFQNKRNRFNLSQQEMRTYYCHKYEYPVPFIVRKNYNWHYLHNYLRDKDTKCIFSPFHECKFTYELILLAKKYTFAFSVLRHIDPIIITLQHIKLKLEMYVNIFRNCL